MANLDIVITDGVSLPVEPGSVDVAYSDQLMEHLHPDDAVAQLENVVRAIRPGGVYIRMPAALALLAESRKLQRMEE